MAAAALATTLLVAGCSSTTGTPDRSALVRSTLRQDVYTLTAMSQRGQYVNARAWVAQLQQDVMYARSAGALSVAQENRLLALLNVVGADLAAKIAASTSRPASSSQRSSTVARSSASRPRPQSQAALGAVPQAPAALPTPTAAPSTKPAPRPTTTSKPAVPKPTSAKKHKSTKKHKHKHRHKHRRKRP